MVGLEKRHDETKIKQMIFTAYNTPFQYAKQQGRVSGSHGIYLCFACCVDGVALNGAR